MANTYTLIASTTVGSGGASSIDFTSIPATYTDLKVVLSCRSNNSSIYSVANLTFNGSTTGYSYKQIEGSGSTATSAGSGAVSAISLTQNGGTSTASTFGNAEAYIPNYLSSNYKSISADCVQETNATTAYVDVQAWLWSNTAAITSMSIAPSSGTWQQYSTAYLYGIKNS